MICSFRTLGTGMLDIRGKPELSLYTSIIAHIDYFVNTLYGYFVKKQGIGGKMS